ncbi:hypothetical protein [Streptomyces sp. NPDC127098]
MRGWLLAAVLRVWWTCGGCNRSCTDFERSCPDCGTAAPDTY